MAPETEGQRQWQGWQQCGSIEVSFHFRRNSLLILHSPHQGPGFVAVFHFSNISVISKIQQVSFPQLKEETAKIHPQLENLYLCYFTDIIRSLQKAIAWYSQSMMWSAMALFSQKPTEAIISEMIFLFRKILFCCKTKEWKYAPQLAMNHTSLMHASQTLKQLKLLH